MVSDYGHIWSTYFHYYLSDLQLCLFVYSWLFVVCRSGFGQCSRRDSTRKSSLEPFFFAPPRYLHPSKSGTNATQLFICCLWSFMFQIVNMSFFVMSAEIPSAVLRGQFLSMIRALYSTCPC